MKKEITLIIDNSRDKAKRKKEIEFYFLETNAINILLFYSSMF